MRSRNAALAIAAPTMVLLGALTSCTGSPTLPLPSETAPAVVDFTTAAQAGTPVAVQIPRGGEIVISFSGPAAVNLESQCWSAAIADPTILAFAPANGSGRAATPPLLTGRKAGQTTAVLTYSCPTVPQHVTFDVTVLSQ